MSKIKTFDPDDFLFDLYAMSREEVEEMLFKEFDKIEPNFEKIKVIIDSGLVDVNAKNNRGWTLLHEACLNDNIECAKLLLDRGAEVNSEDSGSLTPLHWTCRNNDLEFAKLLLDRGADLEAEDDTGWTPLHFACLNDNIECAKLLRDRGADVGAKNFAGRTPFNYTDSKKMKALLKKNKKHLEM